VGCCGLTEGEKMGVSAGMVVEDEEDGSGDMKVQHGVT
jgi:hypothetical protein